MAKVEEVGDKRFKETVKILSITIESDVPVCLDSKPLDRLLWSFNLAKEINDGSASRRPGVFVIPPPVPSPPKIPGLNEFLGYIDKLNGIKGLRQMTAKAKIPPPESSKTAKAQAKAPTKASTLNVEIEITEPEGFVGGILVGQLVGQLETLTMAGIVSDTAKGKQKIEVSTLEEPKTFVRKWGDMQWYFCYKQGDHSIVINKIDQTRLELFWLFDYPGKMFYRGVWIEVLRLLAMECYGLHKKIDVIRRVTNYCHSGTGLRYDSYTAENHYGPGGHGGAFDLAAYLSRTKPFLICYDQAGALQTLLAAIGITVTWVFMEPFGYINLTNLVGRGKCNSTTFLSSNLPEVIDNNDMGRSHFGNHAFCIWEDDNHSIALDATTGTHFGENVKFSLIDGFQQHYVNTAIDGLTTLYRNKNHSPGFIYDMNKTKKGIIAIQSITESPFDDATFDESPIDEKKFTHAEKEIVKQFRLNPSFQKADAGIDKDKGLVIQWESFNVSMSENDGGPWRQNFENIRYGKEESVKHWGFARRDEHINVEIYVGNSIKSAKNRLIFLSLSNSLVPLQIKNKQPLGLFSHYYWHPYYYWERWWYYNICVDINIFSPSTEPGALAKDIQDQIIDKQKIVKNLPLPSIEKITTKPCTFIKMRQKITIQVFPKVPDTEPENDSLVMQFFIEGKSLRFVKETRVKNRIFELTFTGIKEGISTIEVLLINKGTLLNSKVEKLAVTVTNKNQ